MQYAKSVNKFKLKFILFKKEIIADDFNHFPTLNEHFNLCSIENKEYDKPHFLKVPL